MLLVPYTPILVTGKVLDEASGIIEVAAHHRTRVVNAGLNALLLNALVSVTDLGGGAARLDGGDGLGPGPAHRRGLNAVGA